MYFHVYVCMLVSKNDILFIYVNEIRVACEMCIWVCVCEYVCRNVCVNYTYLLIVRACVCEFAIKMAGFLKKIDL